jgi:diguanylate cyclase (GGDEF)-like protein
MNVDAVEERAAAAVAGPSPAPGSPPPETDHYETLPVGLLTVDRRLQVRRANAQGRQLLGLGQRAAEPGRRLLDRLSPPDRERLLGAVASPAVARGLFLGEFVLGAPGEVARVVRIDARQPPGTDEVLLACVDVTAARRRTERAERLALHDPLTGLPNRALALQRLEAALAAAAGADDARVGVLFVDLDRFKALNDSLGHEAGDRLLCEVATRLRGALGEAGVPARLGGDEFLVVLAHLGPGADPLALAVRLLEAVRRPWRHGGHEILPAASAGLALCPDDAVDAPGLLRAADRALYRAKRDGRNAARRFDAGLDGAATQPPAWATQLHQALKRCELRLHYQPQARLADDRLSGLCAVLRWQHPQHGLLAPGIFLPLAEEGGLAPRLGAWVLAEAAGQWQRWHSAGQAPPRLAVKLSPRQLAQAGLDALVTDTLEAQDMPPQALQLEVTDQALAAADPMAVDSLAALRYAGVGLAVDRFGSGASSLPRLSRLRPQLLRIDRGIVGGLPGDRPAQAVVEAAVAMARALGGRVLADGVETPAQRERLAACGVDEYQGPLLGWPVPAGDIATRLGA